MQEKDEENYIELSSEMSRKQDAGASLPFGKSVSSSQNVFGSRDDSEIEITPSVQVFQDIIESFEAPEIFKMKSEFYGPYGGILQPLTRFDSVVLMSAGSGASFTLPVALDLLKTIKARDEADDYLYRPTNTAITIVIAVKRIANLQWYDHLWEEFLPFLNSGRAHLSVHVTQEFPDATDVEGEDSGGENENSDASQIREIVPGGSSNFSGISMNYTRPDFASIIGDAVKLVSSKDYRKSFACLGCGPGEFNGEIRRFCDKNRWVEGAPNVYCYTESFG